MDNKIPKRNLDRAGKIIRLHRDDEEYHTAIETLNHWREQHILPMDSYFDNCNNIISSPEYKDTIVAERLKRLPTIIDKLNRFPHMRLSDMQDIGGVRVILKDVQHLITFDEKIRKLPTLRSSKDYLAEPKSSGYRGRHLIFRHDNVLTEIQLRTQLQHLWATSVETIDVIRGTSMKTKQSDSYWQKFFELASSAFAYMEDLPMLPQHQDWDVIHLRDEIRNMVDKYPIEESLKTYAATYGAIDGHEQTKNSYYAVVTFNSCNKLPRSKLSAPNSVRALPEHASCAWLGGVLSVCPAYLETKQLSLFTIYSMILFSLALNVLAYLLLITMLTDSTHEISIAP